MAELKLDVPGQGVLLFTAEAAACSFVIADEGADGLLVEWAESVVVRRLSAPEPYNTESVTYSTERAAQRWFSLDAGM